MTDYIPNAAYFLPDGREAIYIGGPNDESTPMSTTGRDEVEVFIPRRKDRQDRPEDEGRGFKIGQAVEPLDGRPLSPRIVDCEKGHHYHLTIDSFPVTYPCPECAKDHDLERLFRESNWQLDQTGGGCTAWAFYLPQEDGGYWKVMVTDDLAAPRRSDDLSEYSIGIYQIGTDGEYVDDNGTWGMRWELKRWDRKADKPGVGCPPGVEWATLYDWVEDTGERVTLDCPEVHALRTREDIPEVVRSAALEAIMFVSREVV